MFLRSFNQLLSIIIKMAKQIEKEKVKRRILYYLNENGMATATEISRKLNLHFYFVKSILLGLVQENKVQELPTESLTIYALAGNQNDNR